LDLKTQNKIKEIVVKGGLQYYEAEVSAIITKILAKGCKVRPVEFKGPSMLSTTPDGCIIQVGVKDRENPFDIIWDFLHEYGHFLSGPPKSEDLRLKREELAWKFAKTELNQYPKLLLRKEEFETYREKCLNDYHRFPHLRICDISPY
jgi:hypothetical protein